MQQALGQRRGQTTRLTSRREPGRSIASGMGRASGIAVVLGHTEAHQVSHQSLRSLKQGVIHRGGNQLFKLAGLARIVIDADGVCDK